MRTISVNAPQQPGQRAAVNAMVKGSPQATAYLERVLSVFPTDTLNALRQHGLKIEVTQGDGPEVNSQGLAELGEYNLLTRGIGSWTSPC